jgi:hypothetical protein
LKSSRTGMAAVTTSVPSGLNAACHAGSVNV